MDPEKSHEIREQVAALAARLFRESDQEFDGVDHALYVVLCEAAREYLSAYPETEDGRWRSRDLWATLQSVHENLEAEASDYDPTRRTEVLPDRPTASIVRDLMKSHPKSSYTSGGSITQGDVFQMAEEGVLKDGMLFYDIQRRKQVTNVIRLIVTKYEGGKTKSLKWEHISDDGTLIQGPFNSPSKCSFAIRGTVHNPYDNWRTADGKTIRHLFMNWKASK